MSKSILKTPVPIQKVLTGSSEELHRLMDRAAYLAHLNAKLAHLLPKPLADHCQVSALKGRTLVIYSDSPGWTTKLRFSAPLLLKTLKKDGIEAIDTKTHPLHSPPPVVKRRARMSKSSSEQLSSIAETISDQKLRNAIKRLASRGTDND